MLRFALSDGMFRVLSFAWKPDTDVPYITEPIDDTLHIEPHIVQQYRLTPIMPEMTLKRMQRWSESAEAHHKERTHMEYYRVTETRATSCAHSSTASTSASVSVTAPVSCPAACFLHVLSSRI